MEPIQQVRELCSMIYQRDILGHLVVPTKSQQFEKYLRDNRLIHLLPSYTKEYKVFENALKQAVQLLNQLVGEKKYILIKTIASYPHVASDIDIVVESASQALAIKEELKKHEPSSFPIDVNHIISWTDSEEVSQTFIWDNLKECRVGRHTVLVPNDMLDTLIRIGHIPFELAEIRLGELMHIFHTAQKIDITMLEKEARKMKWPQTFDRMKNMIDALHNGMYGVYLFPDDKRFVSRVIHNLVFPYRLSYGELLQAVVEKRSWGKIKGARYIIRDRFPWLKNIIS